jgi:DNA modification methylase
MRYLIKLVTPKNGIVMDPFMGSGSTGIGALIEGFNFVGMEMDPGYFEIAKQRIDHSDQYMELLDSKKKTIIKKETKKAKCKVSQEENQSIQIGIWANRNLKRIA